MRSSVPAALSTPREAPSGRVVELSPYSHTHYGVGGPFPSYCVQSVYLVCCLGKPEARFPGLCTLSVYFISIVVLCHRFLVRVFCVQIQTVFHTGEGDCICQDGFPGTAWHQEVQIDCPVEGPTRSVIHVKFSDNQVRLSYVPRNREELDLSKRKAGHHSLTIREDVLLIHEGYADRKAGSAVAYFKAPDSGAVQRFEYLRGVR